MDKVFEAYKNLSVSVVNLAISDRKESLSKLEWNPDDKYAKALLVDCIEFFESEIFGDFLEMSGIELKKEDVKELIYER